MSASGLAIVTKCFLVSRFYSFCQKDKTGDKCLNFRAELVLAKLDNSEIIKYLNLSPPHRGTEQTELQ